MTALARPRCGDLCLPQKIHCPGCGCLLVVLPRKKTTDLKGGVILPRHNRPKRRSRDREYLPHTHKPGGKKRPKNWHHGGLQGERFMQAEQAFRQAEGEAA